MLAIKLINRFAWKTERTSWDVMASHDAISGFLIPRKIHRMKFHKQTTNWFMAGPPSWWLDGSRSTSSTLLFLLKIHFLAKLRGWKFPKKKHGFPLHVETSSCQSGPDKPTLEPLSLKDIWRERRWLMIICKNFMQHFEITEKSILQGQVRAILWFACDAETPHPQGSAALRYL